ncbi:hypothetical protein [Halalkalibacter urbisdiaboli]|uniref:hypothetical protein n=1 Tax=Halalkalibacter urbisdiaboli TaxID=1960589 RepID=UPI000B44390F|nr:hypothetical protein [Halalkalibacter urbisdiaboli]
MAVGSLALFAILALGVFLLLLGVKGVSKSKEEEREEMVKLVYHYAVAFITLIMVIGGGVFAFMAVADYVSPNTYIESFEDYKNMYVHQPKEQVEAGGIEHKSDEELREQYVTMKQQRIENAKQQAINSLIKSLGWIIIPLPIYLIFQRRISREKKVI